jgi:DNA-binding NtrC family response regulator
MARLLVVEKRGEIQRLLRRRFPAKQLTLDAVSIIDRVLDRFSQKPYDVLIWDADVSKAEQSKAFEVFETLSKDSPHTEIVVVDNSANGGLKSNVIKDAAVQSINRPDDEEKLLRFVERALERQHTGGDAEPLHPDVRLPVDFEGILAISLPMRDVIQRILEAASSDVPVLITGETGTGKNLVAAAIHKRSKRRESPYISVNTGAMPVELIATELFGHAKGAYTGAFEPRQGLFEQAHRGTIFLDEISTMDERAQVSLLRMLESNSFRRIGGEKDILVDVRVIAATNENLEQAVKEKRFREDLFYRLDVFQIHVPPLRERPGAITLLTDHFASHFDLVYGKKIRAVAPETYRYLRRYTWPGNVRELKNVIQRAILMAKGEKLTPDLIPARIREAADSNISAEMQRFPIHVGMTLEAVEKEFIAMTLASTGGNKKEAASVLGISRRALYNKLKKHGLL